MSNIHFKAVEGSFQPVAPVSEQEALGLKEKVEESLVEIQQAKKYDEYFEMSDRAEIEILEAKLKSTLTLLNHFLKTGEWIVPTGPSGTDGAYDSANEFRDLKPGWNGNSELRNRSEHQNLVEGADYAGTIFVKGDENPRLALQVSATATKLEAFNRGKDIIYVETYKDDQGNEKKRYWVGKDHVILVNANDPKNIAIDAHHLDHTIKIDFSRAYRISDGTDAPYGTVGGFYIVGSDYRDDIIGSQGDDFIAGLKGSDTLSGMGGRDIIYGDDWEDWKRSRTTEIPDGDDTIDGGAGVDSLDGGGGLNTGLKTDPTTGSDPESKIRIQDNIEVRGFTPSGWLDSTQTYGWTAKELRPGEVEIRETFSSEDRTHPNSVLSLKMPEGYDMAFAEQLSDNTLKITLVKHKEGEPPQTFTIYVKDALSPRLSSLKDPFVFIFSGNGAANIIDFHDVNFGNNIAHIKGAEKNDMILAPQNILVEDGLTLESLLNPDNRMRMQTTQTNLTEIIPHHDEEDAQAAGKDIHAVVNNKNEIEISRLGTGTDKKPLSINAKDFDKAYVLVDPSNSKDLLVVLVKKGASGAQPQTVVIRIKDYEKFQGSQGHLGNLFNWLKIGSDSQDIVIPLIYKDFDGDGKPESGTILEGGDGEDFVFKAKQDLSMSAESVVEGTKEEAKEEDPQE